MERTQETVDQHVDFIKSICIITSADNSGIVFAWEMYKTLYTLYVNSPHMERSFTYGITCDIFHCSCEISEERM